MQYTLIHMTYSLMIVRVASGVAKMLGAAFLYLVVNYCNRFLEVSELSLLLNNHSVYYAIILVR